MLNLEQYNRCATTDKRKIPYSAIHLSIRRNTGFASIVNVLDTENARFFADPLRTLPYNQDLKTVLAIYVRAISAMNKGTHLFSLCFRR